MLRERLIFQEFFLKLKCLIEYELKFIGKYFAEKPSKKAGGAFIDFPHFAYAHCTYFDFCFPMIVHSISKSYCVSYSVFRQRYVKLFPWSMIMKVKFGENWSSLEWDWELWRPYWLYKDLRNFMKKCPNLPLYITRCGRIPCRIKNLR